MTALIDQDRSDSQKPWKLPPGADHIELWINALPLDQAALKAGWTPETYRADLAHAAAVWNQSPCIDMHIVQLEPGYTAGSPNKCPAGKNCVPLTIDNGGGDDGNFDAKESGGFTVGGAIQVNRSLSRKTNTAGCSARRNVIAHEIGHASGLVHRKARVLMNGDTYSDICDADPDEYRNLLFDYGRQRR